MSVMGISSESCLKSLKTLKKDEFWIKKREFVSLGPILSE